MEICLRSGRHLLWEKLGDEIAGQDGAGPRVLYKAGSQRFGLDAVIQDVSARFSLSEGLAGASDHFPL